MMSAQEGRLLCVEMALCDIKNETSAVVFHF